MHDQDDDDRAVRRFAIAGIMLLALMLIWLLATGEMIVHGGQL